MKIIIPSIVSSHYTRKLTVVLFKFYASWWIRNTVPLPYMNFENDELFGMSNKKKYQFYLKHAYHVAITMSHKLKTVRSCSAKNGSLSKKFSISITAFLLFSTWWQNSFKGTGFNISSSTFWASFRLHEQEPVVHIHGSNVVFLNQKKIWRNGIN